MTASRKIYEVKIHVTEIIPEQVEGSGYSKTTTPAQVTDRATVSLKGDSSEAILSQITTILPEL